MTEQQPPQPQHRPGDVVNGHQLTPDGRWVPVAPGGPMSPGMPAGTAPAPTGVAAPTKKPVWKRWWFIALAAVAAIVVLGNLAGGGDEDEQPAARPTASAEPEPADEPDEEPAEEEPADEEPAEEEPPANPFEEAYGTFEPVTVTGVGDGVVPVPATVGVVTASHDGSRNFAVTALDANNESTGDLLVNTIGAYAGTTAYGLSSFTDAANLQVMADGNWSITIVPIAAAPPMTLPAAGVGDAVLLYDGGAATWTITHDGSSNIAVLAYGDWFPDLMVNDIGPYNGTVPASAGPSVVTIKADGGWTITPQ